MERTTTCLDAAYNCWYSDSQQPVAVVDCLEQLTAYSLPHMVKLYHTAKSWSTLNKFGTNSLINTYKYHVWIHSSTHWL